MKNSIKIILAVVFVISVFGSINTAFAAVTYSPVYRTISWSPSDSSDCAVHVYPPLGSGFGIVATYVSYGMGGEYCRDHTSAISSGLCNDAFGSPTVVVMPAPFSDNRINKWSTLQCSANTPSPCTYTGPQSWGAGCSANGTWNAASGGTATVNNTAAGYTGSLVYSCTNGTWGGPVSQSCNAVAASPCVLPWGGSIASGNNVTAYQAPSVTSPASCVSQSRTCTNGTLSGSYTNSSCSVVAAAASPCALPWGGSIASGNNVTAYQSSSVVSPASCVSQARLCTNGSLSGSYTNSSCSVVAAAASPCTYTGPLSWGAGCSANSTWNAASGGTATVNNTAGGYTGSQVYSCSNGTWGGPVSQSCNVVAAPTGTVAVSSNISASWTITGPATIPGSGISQSSPSQPTGTYTITWGGVAGYNTPASQSITLTSGNTITFSGTYTSVCVAGVGSACSSAANACGASNGGTIQCNGSCSASIPALPASYGTACSKSSACGTNNGTTGCSGSCSVSAPVVPVNYGFACSSAANACGMTNGGTILCSGSCSASAPPNSSCPASNCGNGTCETNGFPSETILTCPADCKAKVKQF